MLRRVLCTDWENTLHPNQHLDILSNLNKRLPFESNTFDTIILSDVLEHIAKPEVLWLEMNHILRPW